MNKNTLIKIRAMSLTISIMLLLFTTIYVAINARQNIEKERSKYYYITQDGINCYHEDCYWRGCDLSQCSDGYKRNQATNYKKILIGDLHG